MRRLQQSRDAGFTLIELLTAMTLLGILLALSAGPWANYRDAKAHKESARLVVAALRNAQVSAVAEAVTYRVDVAADGRSVTVWRDLPATDERRQTVAVTDSSITLSGAAFIDSAGTTQSSVFFYPRGSASPGDLTVARADSEKQYDVEVEGLTGRVSYE